MTPALVLFYAWLLGFATGLRSLTGPAVLAWAAHEGWIHLQGTPLAFLSSTAAVAVLSVLAILELIADKLPQAPNRTSPPGLVARFGMGALVGAALAFAGAQSALFGTALGALGGLAGAFAGFHARRRLVKALGTADFLVALLEDVIAIGGAFFIVSRFAPS